MSHCKTECENRSHLRAISADQIKISALKFSLNLRLASKEMFSYKPIEELESVLKASIGGLESILKSAPEGIKTTRRGATLLF